MIKRKRPLPQVPFGRILFMGAWRIERKSAFLRALIYPLHLDLPSALNKA
jgi:hypothetical protein